MTDSKFRVKYGPWAVVTGGSNGIGKEMAIEIARRGVNVVLVARQEDRLGLVADEIRGLGAEALIVAGDMSLVAGREAVRVATKNLDIGLFVPAAGFGTSGPFLAASIGNELRMIEVNCSAVTDLTYHYAQRLVARGSGAIVLFSSIVAFQGVPNSAVYAASKAFNQSLAEALRLELSAQGIDVMSLAPAMVRSGFASQAGMNVGLSASAQSVARAAVKALGTRGTVRPGYLAKALEIALTVPRWARSRIMGQVMGSMVAR